MDTSKIDTNDLISQLLPAGSQLSFGALCGYASGYTLRAGGKIAGVLLGGGFMFVQSLSYLGYIEVDWRGVEKDYYKVFDRNGDGKITKEDFKIMLDNTTDVLKFNLPAGSGFTAGLAYGLSGSMKLGLLATAIYPLGTSAAVGEMPQDLLGEVLKGPSNILDRIKSSDFNLSVKPPTLADSLNKRSIEELRQIEYEVKNNITVTQELLGLNKYQKGELLAQIEESKKIVKGR